MKQPRDDSRSDVQQDLEKICVLELEKLLGFDHLHNEKLLHFKSPYIKTAIKPDIYSENDKIIGEVHTHIGKLKAAQVDKLAGDILKMIAYEANLGEPLRKILVVCDEEEERFLRGDAFIATAIELYGIEVHNIPLNSFQRDRLMNAMKNQSLYRL